MVIPKKCMVSKIQKDLLGIALKWGSPILAETYAVLQMKMIRNSPFIHQGFIGYDAISQNIREKPGFCTLQGPLSGPLRGRDHEGISSHWKPPAFGGDWTYHVQKTSGLTGQGFHEGLQWMLETLDKHAAIWWEAGGCVARDKPNGNGRLREDIPKVITVYYTIDYITYIYIYCCVLLWFGSDLHRDATCYPLHQIFGHDMHVQSWIVAPWVV